MKIVTSANPRQKSTGLAGRMPLVSARAPTDIEPATPALPCADDRPVTRADPEAPSIVASRQLVKGTRRRECRQQASQMREGGICVRRMDAAGNRVTAFVRRHGLRRQREAELA